MDDIDYTSTDWRPIETAPKEGDDNMYILGWDWIARACVVITWEGDGRWVEAWHGTPAPDCTHWMPLPAPPG